MFIKMNENLKIFLPSSGSLSKGSLDYFEKSELIISKKVTGNLLVRLMGVIQLKFIFKDQVIYQL